MITVDTFFSSTLQTVDAVISNFVNTAYAQFVQTNAEMISLLFTFYVMILGYRFLTRTQSFDLSMMMRHLIVLLCVYSMVMNWNLYNLFVYKVFTIEPQNVARILVNSISSNHMPDSVAEALDGIYAAIIYATMGFFSQVNFSVAGIAFIAYGILVFVIGVLLCVFALLLFVYAKMMMAVALALGPIFILFILWEPTKGMFSAWLNKLVTLALIPIVTSAILVLMLSVIHVTLPNIKLPTENMQFYGIAPFLGLSLATVMILAQVFKICSSLGGGITLTSISMGAAIATSTLERTGALSAGRFAANWSRGKAIQIRKRIRGN